MWNWFRFVLLFCSVCLAGFFLLFFFSFGYLWSLVVVIGRLLDWSPNGTVVSSHLWSRLGLLASLGLWSSQFLSLSIFRPFCQSPGRSLSHSVSFSRLVGLLISRSSFTVGRSVGRSVYLFVFFCHHLCRFLCQPLALLRSSSNRFFFFTLLEFHRVIFDVLRARW